MLYKKLMGSAMTKGEGYKLKERGRAREEQQGGLPYSCRSTVCVEATHAQAASGLRLRIFHAEEAARGKLRDVRKEGRREATH